MKIPTLIVIVVASSALLSLVAVGLRASFQDATYLFRRPAELARALLAMNVILPIFAVTLISLFDLTPAVKIALVALSVSPIPPTVAMRMTRAGGTESYAVGLQIAVGLLAIVLVPLSLVLIGLVRGVDLHVNLGPVATAVFITVVIPLVVAMVVHSFAPVFAERMSKPFGVLSSIGLVVGVSATWITAAPYMWSLVGNGTVLVLVAFVVVGLAVGHALGGPNAENRPSLAISTASRHPGIAVILARATFPGEDLVVAAVLLYLLVNVVISIPYVVWIKRRQQAPEREGVAPSATAEGSMK